MTPPMLCTVEGCDRLPRVRGWCHAHYQRWLRHDTTDPVPKAPAAPLQTMVCTVDGCDQSACARGWCPKHYSRWDRYGDPLGSPPPLASRAPRGRKVCAVDGCGEPSRVRGWCRNHYGRWLRYGDPLGSRPPRAATMTVCAGPGCDREAVSKELCASHRAQVYRGEELRPLRRYQSLPTVCTADGCDRDAVTRGWCGKHYNRWRRHGEPAGCTPHRGDCVT